MLHVFTYDEHVEKRLVSISFFDALGHYLLGDVMVDGR